MSALLRMYPGDAWAFLIANAIVQTTVAVLAAWLLARIGRCSSAAWRHSICQAALFCVLASPVLAWAMEMGGFTLVTLRSPGPPALSAVSVRTGLNAPISQSSRVEAAMRHAAAQRAPVAAETPGQGPPAVNPSSLSFSDILRAFGGGAWAIWLAGLALLLARWCHGLHVVARLRRESRPLDGEAIRGLLGEVRRALGADRLPPIATSARLDRPVMLGLIRPLVVLPETVLRTVQGPKLADVLVHECAHAVGRHQAVGLLQRLAGTLFWPHPLVHLLNRELARAREEVCDNYVLRRGDAPRYARTLLEVSQLPVGISPKPAALGLFHCRWRLEDRIAGLLDRRRKIMIRVNRWNAAALTAMFLLFALVIAGTRVLQAEPAAGEQAAPAATRAAANREAAQDPELQQSATNLSQIMSALHTYHGMAGHFPAAKFGWGYDRKAKEWFRERPYVSWRVLLLPLLGEKELFEKFRTSEPWDSEHNRKLIPLIPKVYRAPGSKAGEGKTNYLGVVGPNAAFPDKGTITIIDFEDGTSNTIMMVEVPDASAVEWTRPEDLPIGTKEPVQKLVGLHKGGFLTVFADGAPQFISDRIPLKTLRLLLIRNDREPPFMPGEQERWLRFVRPGAGPDALAK